MIVIDTSVWADHFRSPEPHLAFLWSQGAIRQHPLVTGELAMGSLRNWDATIASLSRLAQTERHSDEVVLTFVKEHGLMGSGIGFIDAHLLVSATRDPDTSLWTRDKRLLTQAERLNLAYKP